MHNIIPKQILILKIISCHKLTHLFTLWALDITDSFFPSSDWQQLWAKYSGSLTSRTRWLRNVLLLTTRDPQPTWIPVAHSCLTSHIEPFIDFILSPSQFSTPLLVLPRVTSHINYLCPFVSGCASGEMQPNTVWEETF